MDILEVNIRNLEMTDFQVYLVTLIYRLNCSYRSLSFQGNVLLEKLNTTP